MSSDEMLILLSVPPRPLVADLLTWVRRPDDGPGSDDLVAATFVIDSRGDLVLAERRSEHVACAGGGPVLSAGEMFFRVKVDMVEVAEVSNQSAGFCPEPESWPAAAAALDSLGVPHPGGFTACGLEARVRP